MLEINVKYRVAKKTSCYSIDLMLIFQKYLVICNESNKLVNSFYQNNIDFLKNGPLNSHKNASNQRRIQSWNEKKLLYHGFAASFSEIPCHLQYH